MKSIVSIKSAIRQFIKIY